MRKYEIMFIVDPNFPEEEIDQLNSQVEGLITEGGGNVLETEKMGRKRLAYEVDRRTEGFYVLLTVEASGEIINEVERRFRVMDNVLRYITVRVDETEKKLEKVKAIRQKKAGKRPPKEPASPEQPAAN
jgi:small subunit ribosomal protein S6